MDVTFCIEALREALARFGRPAIFNTDQGSRFTYNTRRPYSTLDGRTPDEAYGFNVAERLAF